MCSLGLKVDNTFSGEVFGRCCFLLVFHVWVMAPRRRWMPFFELESVESSGGSAWTAVCDVSRDDGATEEPLRTEELIEVLDTVDTVLDTVGIRIDPESVYDLCSYSSLQDYYWVHLSTLTGSMSNLFQIYFSVSGGMSSWDWWLLRWSFAGFISRI